MTELITKRARYFGSAVLSVHDDNEINLFAVDKKLTAAIDKIKRLCVDYAGGLLVRVTFSDV